MENKFLGGKKDYAKYLSTKCAQDIYTIVRPV